MSQFAANNTMIFLPFWSQFGKTLGRPSYSEALIPASEAIKFLKRLGLFWRNSKYLASNLKDSTVSNFLARKNLSTKASSVLRNSIKQSNNYNKHVYQTSKHLIYSSTRGIITNCIYSLRPYSMLNWIPHLWPLYNPQGLWV